VAAWQLQDFTSQCSGSRIWWLDDDIELCRQMHLRLQACGWQLTTFNRPDQLLAALQSAHPDLLLLDQRLPQQLGTDLLLALRSQGHAFPVLMISGLGTAEDRILGLELGAQDYLVKPFHPRELLLRCEQLLRNEQRTTITPRPHEQQLPLGDLTFLPHQGVLLRPDGPALNLSRGEASLLLALYRAPGRTLSRQQLARASGSLAPRSERRSRSIDMRLSRLRRLLGEASAGRLQIETLRGHGYALRIEPAATATPEEKSR
jgi:DNA-binding response OmpR family regulator